MQLPSHLKVIYSKEFGKVEMGIVHNTQDDLYYLISLVNVSPTTKQYIPTSQQAYDSFEVDGLIDLIESQYDQWASSGGEQEQEEHLNKTLYLHPVAVTSKASELRENITLFSQYAMRNIVRKS